MLLTLRNGHKPLDIFNNIFNDTVLNLDKGYADFVLEDDQYHLEVPLAGFKKEDIEVTSDQEYLNVFAKRKGGKVKYERSFYLPRKTDLSEIKAKYEDGLLTITFGKENEKIQNKIRIN